MLQLLNALCEGSFDPLLCQLGVLYPPCSDHSGVVVSLLDFRSEGRWFEAWSQQSCCFLRQETLLHTVSLPRCINRHGLYTAGSNPAMD